MQPGCLTITNNSRHADIVCRAVSAIEDLRKAGEKISFYSVAAKAQVSRSTLYRSKDLRELVEAARSDGAPSERVQSEDPDARIAELEGKLAMALLERDELERAIHDISPVYYTFTQVADTA